MAYLIDHMSRPSMGFLVINHTKPLYAIILKLQIWIACLQVGILCLHYSK